MEDPDSAESKAWVAAENELTANYLKKIPARARIEKRLTELWNFERYSSFFKASGRYFYLRNDGLQNQNVLYTVNAVKGSGRMLLDPNALSKDGTVALSGLAVSDNGKRLAYSISRSGSDWQEWRVRDIDSGKDLPDLINWSKFSSAGWSTDNRGFYYQRFPEPNAKETLTGVNQGAQLYYHALGDPQASDKLIYERPDHKDWNFDGSSTEDGRYLILQITQGAEEKNLVFYRDLKTPGSKVVELVNTFEGAYNFLGNEGPIFYFRTSAAAPLGRVIAIDVNKPERGNWKEIVAEQKEKLDDARMAGGMLVLSYLKDAYSATKIYKLNGAFVRDVALPGIGTVAWSGARLSDTELFYSYTTFTEPSAIYRYDLKTGANELVRRSKLSFDPAAYETRQVFYTSKDGTRIPMFLVYKKGLQAQWRESDVPVWIWGIQRLADASFQRADPRVDGAGWLVCDAESSRRR